MSPEIILEAPESDHCVPGDAAGMKRAVSVIEASPYKETDLFDDLVRTPARRVLPVILLALAPAVHAQQTPPTPPTQQREHIVKPGDTLWDLARIYLMNPFLWPLIFEANNPGTVENPHRIYPSERLIIPGLQPATPADPIGEPVTDPLPMEVVVVDTMVMDSTPVEPTVVASLDLRTPVVPLSEYRASPWLSSTAVSDATGRIVRLADPAADEDRLPTTLHPHTRVHVGSVTARPMVGDSLLVVRIGRGIQGFGRIVEPLAVLAVDSVSETVITAVVAKQFSDAKVGDLVMPLGAAPEIAVGRAEEDVEGGVEGNLLQFLVQEPLHGTSDVAFVSLGAQHGLGIGDELGVYVPTRALDNERPERLPATQVGTVRVIRVDDRTATVRVLTVSSAALRDGLPVRLVRRMP